MIKKPKFRGSALMLFSALLISLTTIVSCRKNLFDPAKVTQIVKTTDQFVIDYQSSVRDSVLSFELQVSNKGKSTNLINEDIEVDLKGNQYLKTIYGTLQERSLDAKYAELTVQQVRELCRSLRQVIQETVQPLTAEQVKSPEIQGLYMSLSLARRILKNKLGKSTAELRLASRRSSMRTMDLPVVPPNTQPSYAQDVYGGYSLGLSSFALNEDIIVNRQAFLNIVNADAAALVQDDQGLYVFQEVLNNMPASSFSLKDLLRELDNYVITHPEGFGGGSGCSVGWWPRGSSHGCCGNYNGCCLYWSPICYVHDKICIKCKPEWFCFSGCKPGVVVPIEEPFTFIEDGGVDVPNEIFLPIPLPESIYYKVNFSDLNLFIPQQQTTIFNNPVDHKYYVDSAFTTLLPVGYYDSPNEMVGNDQHKYYYIVNGVVLTKYNVSYGATPNPNPHP